jgi:MFS family permease
MPSSIVLRFFTARFVAILALQMQSVAIGWDVYDRTHRALDLGYVGLAQFVPAAALSLFAGAAADRFDRRKILIVVHLALAALTAALFFLPRAWGIAPVYGVLVLLGVARAFSAPASQALLPDLVPKEEFARTVAQSSSVWQIGVVVGPALGGIAFGAIGANVYAACGVLFLLAALAITSMPIRSEPRARRAASWDEVTGGIRYVWQRKLILGSISLDLFAVLLGGAVALLPIFARDVLFVGPWGMGLLRSAPAAGAAVTGLVLARWPLSRRAGPVMLVCVGLFGLATIAFGASTSLATSIAALVVTGAADMVSVVVRLTLVQLETPAEMRGRVSAVNSVFIGASNELGELESGLTAAWLGAERAVILGGVGTLVVVVLWTLLFPGLRRVDRLDQAAQARS